MIQISTFVFNDFQENTYVLFDETNECLIIDAGISNKAEENKFFDYVKSNHLNPVALLNTHCHIDHILGCRLIKDAYNIPFYIHEEDLILINKANEFAAIFGMRINKPPMPDKYLADMQAFKFGDSSLQILHVPGHSAGSICFYSQKDKIILTGDVLFNGSVGRTDLPGGNYNTLINGIKSKLLVLPDDVSVFSGHGPITTIGQERKSNPFLQ